MIYKRLLPHMRNDLNARSATHTVRSYGEQFQVLQHIWRAVG